MREGVISEQLHEIECITAYGIQLQISLWLEYDKKSPIYIFQNQ